MSSLSLTRRLMAGTYGSGVTGDYPTVSNEEAAILESEAGSDVAITDATLGEVESMQDRADNLETTADYAEANMGGDSGEVTQNEAVLLSQATDAATVGTGEDSESLIPSLESYIGTKSRVSVESIRDMVKSFWATIREAISKVWATLKRYYRKYTSRLSSIVKSAKELRETAGKKTSMSSGDVKKVTVSSGMVEALSGEKRITNYGDISTSLTDIENHTKYINETWVPKIISVGKDLADTLNDVDEDNVGDKLKSLNAKVKTDIMGVAPNGYSDSNDRRFKDTGVVLKVSKQLAGGKAIFLRHPTSAALGATDERAIATAIQSAEMTFTDFSDKERNLSEADIDILQPTQVQKLCDTVIEICDKMRNYAEGRGFEEMEKTEGKVTKAGNKATEKMAKIEDRRTDDEGERTKNAEAVRSLRGIQRYATTWTRWSKNPQMGFSNHICSVMRAALSVGSSSMAKFTKG